MSTKLENILDPESCWTRAGTNEPVFVLRSTDPIAPEIIIMWANRYLQSKGGWNRMTPQQQVKFNDACAVAREMKKFHETEFFDDDIPF